MTVTREADFPFCCVQVVGSRIPYLNFQDFGEEWANCVGLLGPSRVKWNENGPFTEAVRKRSAYVMTRNILQIWKAPFRGSLFTFFLRSLYGTLEEKEEKLQLFIFCSLALSCLKCESEYIHRARSIYGTHDAHFPRLFLLALASVT